MHLQETVLCATSPTSPGAGPGQIAIHDIQTGATLATFKQTNAGTHSVAVLESRNAQGGFILASQPDKSILNVYNFQKDQISLKAVLPEKLTCITLDRRGDLCAGGTAAGRIYLWETASGIMFKSWEAHYRQVNVLRFTNDGAALLSGSDDSGVNVWSVSRLLDNETQMEHMVPYCSLADHTLPVTDIICGVGIFPECRVLTSSVDHSVKLWDLSSRSLLTTFQFPQAIACLAWDITERLFFAASSDGSIHQMNLFREKESKAGLVVEAIGGGGASDVVRVESDATRNAKRQRLISVGQPVNCMAISLSSTNLVVGTSEGLIQIYDIPSHQLIRTISTHKGVPISHVQTMLKPPDLIGHITLEIQIGSEAKDVIPVKPVMPFQRIKDPKTREAHEITVMLPQHIKASSRDPFDYGSDELLRDHSFFMEPLEGAEGSRDDPLSLRSRVSELEDEVEALKEQLGKAKGMNDAMWDTVVQKLVGQTAGVGLKGKDPAEKDADEDQRKRKRGRG